MTTSAGVFVMDTWYTYRNICNTHNVVSWQKRRRRLPFSLHLSL